MQRHILKTDPAVFKLTAADDKLYEIRFDDRDFQIGDELLLVETVYSGEQMKVGALLEYTGMLVCMSVTHKLKNVYGLKDGWCILGCFYEYTVSNFDPKDNDSWLAEEFPSNAKVNPPAHQQAIK